MALCRLGWCVQNPWVLIGIPIAIIFLWFLMRKNFVQLKTKEEADSYKRRTKYMKGIVFTTRVLLVILLFAALATPYRSIEREVDGDVSLKLLIDNSTSFDVFDKSIIGELETELAKHIPVNTKLIGRGEKSALGDGLLNNVGEDENILIISDGNANVGKPLGDMVLFAANLNATISMVDVDPIRDDAAIQVLGPSEVIAGSEATYEVRVAESGSPDYKVEVLLDGNPVTLSDNKFTARPSVGYHKIQARMQVDDYFSQNNEFYKTLHVIPKPNVAFISQKDSRLEPLLDDIYDVDSFNQIPADLNAYHALVFNDLPASAIDPHIDRLSEFLIQGGNGILFIGGESSFDRGSYKNSLAETILPVKAGKGKPKDSPDISTVLLIDISGSSSNVLNANTQNSRIEFAKALAVAILGDFDPENKVGVIAFNEEAHVVTGLGRLAGSNASRRIASLQAGGGTFIENGLTRAATMLADEKGSRNIVLLSDGITNNGYFVQEMAKTVSKAGIRIFTVGLGEGTDDAFMEQIASIGNGIYLQPDEHERLNLIFGPPQDKDDQFSSLVVSSKNHFIGRNMQLATSVVGFNYVVPKSAATAVITTDANHPIVSTWRFGLGRVVAMTTDDGGKWAGTLLKKQNFNLFSKSLNYAIGDPTRTQEVSVKIRDVNLPDPLLITVGSPEPPNAEGLSFYKLDKELYGATASHQDTGFYEYLGATGAVNYPSEYRELGMNPLLKNIVEATGGKSFNPDDIDGIVEHVRTVSKRIKSENVSYRWPFVIAALVIYLLEIFVRRLHENKSVIN